MNKSNCKQCNKPIDIWDTFPDGLCVDCYEYKTKDNPITMPNFIKTIKSKGGE